MKSKYVGNALLFLVLLTPLASAVPTSYSTTWTGKDNKSHTVTTPCKTTEQDEACISRHAKELAKEQKKYPPKKD